MSLKERHVGRRVAGVGVAVALMVLGLQAPAFAAVSITAITPNNGPDDCVVVITGSGFAEFPEAQTTVEFVNPGDTETSPDFFVISDTEIWAEADFLEPGLSYNVRITNPGNSPAGVTSTVAYLNTTAAAGCAPTITSFVPTCGAVGTTVVITGTNLFQADPFAGADVFFSPYDTAIPPAVEATHTVPDVDSPTSLSVIVPTGTTDGPIKVITDAGTVFSTGSFLVPPPDCVPATTPEHARAVTFKLKKSGAASGVVSSTEDPAFTDCVASVPVKIQKKKKGDGWKTKATATTTDTGSYSANINVKPGKYRAVAPKVDLGTPTVTDSCLKAKSAVRKIG